MTRPNRQRLSFFARDDRSGRGASMDASAGPPLGSVPYERALALRRDRRAERDLHRRRDLFARPVRRGRSLGCCRSSACGKRSVPGPDEGVLDGERDRRGRSAGRRGQGRRRGTAIPVTRAYRDLWVMRFAADGRFVSPSKNGRSGRTSRTQPDGIGSCPAAQTGLRLSAMMVSNVGRGFGRGQARRC